MLNKAEIIRLLSEEKKQDELFIKADSVRKQYVGDEIHIRGLIEFSNICRNSCLYCGIRSGNNKLSRYRMSEEDIINTAQSAIDNGFKTIVMQSGEDIYFTKDKICRIIEAIKKNDVAITLSIGERSYEDYKSFKNAGADRYLMRIETTDKELYHKLNPNMSWQQRYECLLMLKELGYELGSGIMVGQPGQTIKSIAEDLLFLKELDIDMAGIGPFIPHKDTPLAKEKGGDLYLSLRTMAIMRLLMPDINIPATTAMETLHPQGRIIALQSGANVVMSNITSANCRKLYELYPNKEKAHETYSGFVNKLHCISRIVSDTHGNHKKIA
jgi:biotin synthase